MEENHSEDPSSMPHFCRTMLGDFRKRLRIPTNFVKYITKEASTLATIIGPSGDIWPIKVVNEMRGTYLQDGWHEFVKDHCLHETDFLTFRYDGNMNFTVRIFDKTSSCEKEDAYVVKAGREEREKRMRSDEIPLANDNMTPKEKTCQSAISLHMYQRKKKFVCSGRNMPLPTSEVSAIMRKKLDPHTFVLGKPLNDVAEAKVKPATPSFVLENPSFTKYMTPLSLSDKALLRIPTNFMKYIEKEAATSATIAGPSGDIWPVEVFQGMSGTYLEDGWHEFVQDHCLQEADILTFRYDGSMNFAVQIFDKSSCEKEDAFFVAAGRGGREKRMKSEGNPLKIDSMPRAKLCPSVISYHGQNKPLPSSEMSARMGKTLHSGTSLLVSPLNVVAEAKEKPESPENPSFMKYMAPMNLSRGAFLVLPRNFWEAHLPHHDMNVVLRDPEGRNWDVKYIYRSNRKFFSGGWLAFMRGNKLKEGDACTFELVGEWEMKVHILHS